MEVEYGVNRADTDFYFHAFDRFHRQAIVFK